MTTYRAAVATQDDSTTAVHDVTVEAADVTAAMQAVAARLADTGGCRYFISIDAA